MSPRSKREYIEAVHLRYKQACARRSSLPNLLGSGQRDRRVTIGH